MVQPRFTIEILDDSAADPRISEFSDTSWRQYPAYAHEAATQIGATSEYAAVMQDGEHIALCNVRIKKLPLVNTGIAFISHGPMCVKTLGLLEIEHYRKVLECLSEHYVRERGLCLRIEPYLYDPDDMAKAKDAFQQAGFTIRQGSKYQTFMIDLAPDSDTLRARLNGKWRTDLNRGQRGNLRITRSQSPESFQHFAPLLQKLAGEKGFSTPQDTDFFSKVASQHSKPDNIQVHLAWDRDVCVGGHIGAYAGDTAVYLLGATNDRGRNLRASYVLQWAVIEYAKSLGLRRYDLGGVDELENPAVHRFKKRMGGDFYDALAGYEKMPGGIAATIIRTAERIYNRVKNKA